MLTGGIQKQIHLFYTNDIQGEIFPQKAVFLNPNFPPVLGGGAAIAGVVNRYRAAAQKSGDVVLLLDGGDAFWGTNRITVRSQGQAVLMYMNRLAYDAVVPGNLDFRYGHERLQSLLSAARFSVLAANLYKAGQEVVRPFTIIERAGIRIGLFGLISKSCLYENEADDMDGWTVQGEVAAAKQAVLELKRQGAQIIIALAHLGLPYDAEPDYRLLEEQEAQNIQKKANINTMELARYVPGIDVIISGRIHRGYDTPWEDPVNHTLCVQNYAYGGNLGLLSLQFDMDSRQIVGYQLPAAEGGLLLMDREQYLPDETMMRFLDSMQMAFDPEYDKPIGFTRNTLWRSQQDQSPMSNLMCDAMLQATGADFAFNNFVGMRQDIAIGPIRPRDIDNVFPFGNKLVVVEMPGSTLISLLESSVAGNYNGLAIGGGTVVVDKSRPDGQRIIGVQVKGRNIVDAQLYRVVTTEYLAEGNYGMDKITYLPENAFEYTAVTVSAAVEAYIKAHNPLAIEKDSRWQLK